MNTTMKRRVLGDVAWYAAVIAISLVTVLPLVWTLLTSFKPAGEILSGGMDFLPRTWTFDNYVTVWQSVPFGRYFLNSTILALAGVVCNVFLGSLAGYAFAKLKFRGAKAFFAMLLASMMVPSIVTMIPTFLVLRKFPLVGGNSILGEGGSGFINSYMAVILPGAVGAFAIFMMKQFFETIPDSYAEAARLDGASEFRIFTRIYLPLAKPGMAVLAILTFQSGWNNFMWPLIVLSDPKMMTVQVGLASFMNDYETDYGPLMAGTVISMIPVLVVFLVCQRYIIEGVSHVGNK
ncbi:carbohydrate ABC transporter permease [Sanguibacter gelidistatuariae]|nr:carbohydrate ABC transporter permease [Sanguibacter gelidistatuariae]